MSVWKPLVSLFISCFISLHQAFAVGTSYSLSTKQLHAQQSKDHNEEEEEEQQADDGLHGVE